LVINKSSTAALNANITLNSYTPKGTLSARSYGIPQDQAARTGVGSADIALSSYSAVGATFPFTFPAYSATVLSLRTAGKPDNLIKLSSESTYLGNNVYNTDATNQTKNQQVQAGLTGVFHTMIQNDGTATDSFTVRGAGSSTGFTVKYYTDISGGTEVTSAITAGTYRVSNLAAGANQIIRVVITVAPNTALNTIKDCLVTSTSVADTTRSDAVKARVTVKQP